MFRLRLNPQISKFTMPHRPKLADGGSGLADVNLRRFGHWSDRRQNEFSPDRSLRPDMHDRSRDKRTAQRRAQEHRDAEILVNDKASADGGDETRQPREPKGAVR